MPPLIEWTKKMDRYLKRHYHSKTASQIASELFISKTAVIRRAKKLNIESKTSAGTSMRAAYTPNDKLLIEEQLKTLGVERVAELLGRSPEAIRIKANRLGLLTGTKLRPLSTSERECIERYITSKTYKEIGQLIGRGEEETRWHARMLGLSRRK
jgi:hypothetical protein